MTPAAAQTSRFPPGALFRNRPGVSSRHKWQVVSAEIANHGDVLHDADASLACWLARVLPAGTKVRFDAPNPGWTGRPPDPPFVDAFLYDVREDVQENQAGWSDVRDAGGRVTERQAPPRRYKVRYLLTAWIADSAAEKSVGEKAVSVTARPGDTMTPPRGPGTATPGGPGMAEHELLGTLLSACATTDVLPAGCLCGALAAAGLPTLLRCAPADGQTDPARLWAGFGLPYRAFLELLLIVPVLPRPDTDLAPPAREIAVGMSKPGAGGTGSAADVTRAADGLHSGRRGPTAPARRWPRSTITEHTIRPNRNGREDVT